jgi:hypothetical protein
MISPSSKDYFSSPPITSWGRGKIMEYWKMKFQAPSDFGRSFHHSNTPLLQYSMEFRECTPEKRLFQGDLGAIRNAFCDNLK